jgi:hypothetical protein
MFAIVLLGAALPAQAQQMEPPAWRVCYTTSEFTATVCSKPMQYAETNAFIARLGRDRGHGPIISLWREPVLD